HRARIRVRSRAKIRRTPTEDFRRGLEVDVYLQPNDHLVLVAPILRRVAHSCAPLPSTRSSAYAAANICRSSKWLAMNCPPTGSPSTRPIGTDIAGTPARFAVHVKMSLRYISYGSDLEPSGNAVVGVVGVKRRCTPLANTFAKSRVISARTRCAFR